MKRHARPMRKTTREVPSFTQQLAILDHCDVMRIGLYDHAHKVPYIVPLNFAYVADIENEELILYFHCAKEGRKVDLIKEDPIIAFEADCDHTFHMHGDAVTATMYFKSIMGEGVAIPIETEEERIAALDALMVRYGSSDPHPHYRSATLEATQVFRIDVTTMSGKTNPGSKGVQA